MKKQNEVQEFNDLHLRGSIRFGFNWFKMNQWIAETAIDHLDIQKHRLLLSEIALKILVNTSAPPRGQYFISRQMKRAERDARVRWLAVNKKLWEGFPDNASHTFNDEYWGNRRFKIVEAMREAKLIAPTTYWKDVNLIHLIIDARKLLRKEKGIEWKRL